MSEYENDEEMVDEPVGDGRRQHKYSTADMKSKFPWKKMCCMCICCLLVIALVILFSMLMQKLFNPDESSDWTDDEVQGHHAVSGEADLLPKDMKFIEDVCTAEKLGDDNERTFCEEACSPSEDCCDVYGLADSTCFQEQMAGCFTYARCHSLNGFVDPAHIDLDRYCSRAGIEVNREECERVCKDMACCWDPINSCVADKFQACLDYAPCQNLREGSAMDVAPIDLDDRCINQTPTCRRDCKEAISCSDVNSKSYRDNFISCLSYSACTDNSDTSVKMAPLYSLVKPAPVDLEQFCSPEGLATHGPASCQLACQDAMCCIADDSSSCFGQDPLGCLEYSRCKVLNTPQYQGLTMPPTTIAPGGAAAAGAAAAATTPPATNTTAPPATNTTSPPATTPPETNATAASNETAPVVTRPAGL